VIFCDIIFGGNTRNIIKIFRIGKIRIIIQGKWILLGKCLKHWRFYLSIPSIYFHFYFMWGTKIFIYKK